MYTWYAAALFKIELRFGILLFLFSNQISLFSNQIFIGRQTIIMVLPNCRQIENTRARSTLARNVTDQSYNEGISEVKLRGLK